MSTQGKTPQEWAEYLPEPIRTQFLENIDALYGDYKQINYSLKDSIYHSFSWHLAKQSYRYWEKIHVRALNGEFSKPIPKSEPKTTEKMTAVEWLESLTKAMNDNEKYNEILEYFSQVKEMEKEQMIDFYVQGCKDTYGMDDGDAYNDKQEAILYYNRTFGGDA